MDRLHSPKIWEIASALRLSVNGSPADAILKFCDDRAETMLAEFPECATPTGLLDVMAAMLGTSFEEVRSDGELIALQKRYVRIGEFGFASLDKDLSGEAYGVTYRRMAACAGERAFVSVIDCRGNKALRSYFTKWHEIGHLLILTDIQRSTFRRTHGHGTRKDPEETLVDVIAGHMGFLPRFLLPEMRTDVTFTEVDRIKLALYPEASFQSSAIAFAKNHHHPCLLLEAKLALKKDEEADLLQGAFTFHDPPTPKLRVHMVVFSDTAKQHSLYIPRNYRVPESSIIHRVHKDDEEQGIGSECLSLWESSDGKHLGILPIRIEVRKSFDSVLALISILDESNGNDHRSRGEAGCGPEHG